MVSKYVNQGLLLGVVFVLKVDLIFYSISSVTAPLSKILFAGTNMSKEFVWGSYLSL